MKRILLAILFIFTTCVFSTFAIEKVKIGDLYYNLNPDDRTAEVTSQNNSSPRWTTNITTANIPASIEYHSTTYRVTSIESWIFYNCPGLTSVTIPNSVTSIGDHAFYDSGLTSVTIPNSVTSIGNKAFGWCRGLTSISVASGNSKYSSSNGVLFNHNKTTLIQYPAEKSGSYSIPNSVTSIGNGAFSACTNLTSVTIPNSVTSIGDHAFSACTNLTSVTIPNSVTSIGNEAFGRCHGITSISVASGNSKYSSSNGVLFNYNKTTLIQYPAGKSGSYSIPNSVTSIGNDAFEFCLGLTSVTIPNSVTCVGRFAFLYCSALKELYYPLGLDLSEAGIPSSAKLIAYSPTTTPTIPAKLPECRIDYSIPENIYHSSSIRLCYSVDSELSDNQEIEFLIDGTPVEPKTLSQPKGVRPVQCTEVELDSMPTIANHVTKVSIRIVDKSLRMSWSEKSIVLRYQSIHKPTLHVFAVGVNKYKAEGFTKLDYAEQDAKDFTNVIMEMADKNMYKKVDTTLILGSVATTFNLQERLTQLSNQVEPNDVVMIFFSGHGLKENKKSYFISSDAIRPYQGLDMEFIRNRADEMECPVFVFMDACHSGPSNDKTKGVIEPIIVADKGVIGFYSCKSGQQSIELKELQNGVFTNVLVRGLKGAADDDKDGYISISDLENYVKKQVPLLSERKQTPIVINTEVGDAILFRIKKK